MRCSPFVSSRGQLEVDHVPPPRDEDPSETALWTVPIKMCEAPLSAILPRLRCPRPEYDHSVTVPLLDPGSGRTSRPSPAFRLHLLAINQTPPFRRNSICCHAIFRSSHAEFFLRPTPPIFESGRPQPLSPSFS